MGTRPKIRNVSLADLHADVLPRETIEALRVCSSLDFLREPWYLAGGTALALQAGHRQSVDLDFFTEEKDFDTFAMERALVAEGEWETTHIAAGTLYGIFHGAKMSLIAYPFFRPSKEYIRFGSIRILIPSDIAAMKIIAISQRGRKRDFIDLYWYTAAHKASLLQTILNAVARYPKRDHSMQHFLKSLVYFEDAEADPMPRIHFDADWGTIKQYFKREVQKIAEELLGIKR